MLAKGKLDRFETFLEILNQVFDVLYSNADADEVVRDSKFESSLLGNAGVRHACRMFDKALDSTQALGHCEYSESCEEFLDLVEAASQLEAEHSSVAAHLAFDYGSLWMVGKSGIVYLLDFGLFGEKFADDPRVIVVTIHSHG